MPPAPTSNIGSPVQHLYQCCSQLPIPTPSTFSPGQDFLTLGGHTISALMEQTKRFEVISANLSVPVYFGVSQASDITIWSSRLIDAVVNIRRHAQDATTRCSKPLPPARIGESVSKTWIETAKLPSLQQMAPFTYDQPQDWGDRQDLITKNRHSIRAPTSTHKSKTPLEETQESLTAISEISLNKPSTTHLQKREVLQEASLQGTADVFNAYMYSAIRKDIVQSGGTTSSKAAVIMVFAYPGLVDCVMSLAISQSEVEHLALVLFGVRVKSVGGVRCIVLGEKVILTPSPEIHLKGVPNDVILHIFGSEIYHAITASRMRKKDLEEGNHITECVSMILTSSSSEGACINLNMDLKGAARVQDKLYT